MVHLLGLLTLVSSIFFGFGCLDEAGARARGMALLHTIDPGLTKGELASARTGASRLPSIGPEGAPVWDIETSGRTVLIDPCSGDLRRYRNDRLLTLLRKGSAPSRSSCFASESEVVARARAKVGALGMRVQPFAKATPLPQPEGRGAVRRQLLTVEFSDRPHGFPTDGAGNFCVIEMDSLTGEVAKLRAGSGYSYGPPTVRIDREAARRTATQALGAAIMPDEVSGPTYCVIDPRDAATPAARAFAFAAISPLCYLVRHKDRSPEGYEVVYLASISCDTGAVLSHFWGELAADGEPIRGDPEVSTAPHVQRDTRARLAQNRVILIVLLGLAALISVALGFGIKNRKRWS